MTPKEVVVVGGGPSGMTVALLLARVGHRVTVLERERGLGGLWACRLDDDGYFVGENSCKVFQSTYETAPALLRSLGSSWQEHFTPRHDLGKNWLVPFLSDCSGPDLAKLARAFVLHGSGLRTLKDVSVAEWLEANHIGEACRSWMRATALGGVTGTLRMTMWEMFHRFQKNLASTFLGADGALHWNRQPPNSDEGFVSLWARELLRLGVDVRSGSAVSSIHEGASIHEGSEAPGVDVALSDGTRLRADAAFLAIPPPALSQLLSRSSAAIADGFGHDRTELREILRESVYEHLGITFLFDRPLPRDLPLGGHNVRRGWHPILVQHDQYRPYLRPPAVTAVTGSVSLDTTFRHPRLGTRACDHGPEELAEILWADERSIDPELPEPIARHVFGLSSATQIVGHGPLPVKASGHPVYLATNLNGQAPYFTSSLESAIQAGAAAARTFDGRAEKLPASGHVQTVDWPRRKDPRRWPSRGVLGEADVHDASRVG